MSYQLIENILSLRVEDYSGDEAMLVAALQELVKAYIDDELDTMLTVTKH
jgi:hypothetical protein